MRRVVRIAGGFAGTGVRVLGREVGATRIWVSQSIPVLGDATGVRVQVQVAGSSKQPFKDRRNSKHTKDARDAKDSKDAKDAKGAKDTPPRVLKGSAKRAEGNRRHGRSKPVKGGKHSAAMARSIRINKKLTSATTIPELLAVHEAEGRDFNPINLATAVHRLGKLADAVPAPKPTSDSGGVMKRLPGGFMNRSERLQVLLAQVQKQLVSDSASFSEQALATIAHGLGNLGVRDATLLETLAGTLLRGDRLQRCTAQNLSNVAWGFARTGMRIAPLFEGIARELDGRLRECTPQHLAVTMWAFAKLEVITPSFFNSVAKHLAVRFSNDSNWEYSTQHLANWAWAFATLGHQDRELRIAIAQAAVRRIHSFSAQGLANTAWAFATYDCIDSVPETKQLFEAIGKAAIRQSAHLQPMHVGMLSWSFAKAEVHHPELFEMLASVGVAKIQMFSRQNISNTLWAFAKLQVPHTGLFSAAERIVIQQAHRLNPQALSNVLSAYCKLELPASKLYHTILNVIADSDLSTYSAQHLALAGWALAKVEVATPRVLTLLAQEATTRLAEFNPQNLTNIAWSCAKADVVAPLLFHGIALEVLRRRAAEMTPHNLAGLAWSFSKLGLLGLVPQLVPILVSESLKQIDHFSTQEITNVLWALSVHSIFTPELFKVASERLGYAMVPRSVADKAPLHVQPTLKELRLLRERTRDTEEELVIHPGLSHESRTQLHMARLATRILHDGQDPIFTLPEQMEKACADAFADFQPRMSALHLSVCRALDAFDVTYETEILTEDGLSIDIGWPHLRAGIEVDGPHHYLRHYTDGSTPHPPFPTPETKLKRNVFAKSGWEVASIPFYLWPWDDRMELIKDVNPLPAEQQWDALDGMEARKRFLLHVLPPSVVKEFPGLSR